MERPDQSLLREGELWLLTGPTGWDTPPSSDTDLVLKYWDDSGAQEALAQSKERKRARALGLRCEIEVPRSDLFTQRVDWDAKPCLSPEAAEIWASIDEEKPQSGESYRKGGKSNRRRWMENVRSGVDGLKKPYDQLASTGSNQTNQLQNKDSSWQRSKNLSPSGWDQTNQQQNTDSWQQSKNSTPTGWNQTNRQLSKDSSSQEQQKYYQSQRFYSRPVPGQQWRENSFNTVWRPKTSNSFSQPKPHQVANCKDVVEPNNSRHYAAAASYGRRFQ